MTKPHEETWTHRIYRGEIQLDGCTIAVFGDGDERGAAFDEVRARAQLATVAPAMARALLKVEWSGRQDFVGDGGYDCCPCCEGIAPGYEQMTDALDDVARGKNVVGHKPTCELATALRAAGVLP